MARRDGKPNERKSRTLFRTESAYHLPQLPVLRTQLKLGLHYCGGNRYITGLANSKHNVVRNVTLRKWHVDLLIKASRQLRLKQEGIIVLL